MRRDSDSSNMSSCRIERKRAHDREAQRASRAKTKAYIAHLEKTVADLSQSSGDNRANYLAQHASQQQNEIDTLQGLVSKIKTLVQDATTKSDDGSPPSTNVPTLKSEGSVDSGFGAEGPTTEPFPASWESPPPSDDSWVDLTKPRQIEDKKEPKKTVAATRRNLIVLGVDMLCEDNEEDCTYFTRLNEALTKVEQTPDTLSNLEEDEDILIRAIVHGWDAAERVHHFDIVWRFLRAFDEGLWYRAAPLERFAHFWQMRSTMLHKIQPKNQPRRHTASFMAPTSGQLSLSTRPAIVDYFGWPQVRNHLLAQGIKNCPSKSSIAFAESFRFVWPFELRDVYKVNRSTGLYSFSEGFLKSFNDLSCFRMLQNDAIPYYVHPSLAQAAAPPKFDRMAECDSSDSSDDGEVTSMCNETVVIPNAEGLMQEAVDASWIPPFTTIDVNGEALAQFMDFYAFSQEAGSGQWPGL